MPNKTPELTRERKQAWYEKHKEEILKRKRERRAAQKKQRVQRPKPAPTPEQIARTRELNRQACYQYRATHLAQVCLINWIYYHRNRDQIVHQQREQRALAKQNKQTPSPFQKLLALADLCSQRLIELDHGYARKEEEVGPQKNRASQRRYQEEKNAAMDGIEQVRAHNCQRYYDRIDRLKATGQYEAFKKKKSQEGLRRYHTMSEEQRNEVRHNKLVLQKAWRDKMIREGTYEAYRQRLNARQREQLAEKKRVMGAEGLKALQRVKYIKRVESEHRRQWQWLDEQLARPFPLPWLPLDWAESKPEEDTVQTIRVNALEQMDQYL